MSAAEAHPPTHELADLAEGVLDDARAREVQAHVDQCLTCQGTLDELAQVTVALRALPAELPVPEFVAARISHALAAERSSGAPAGGVGGGEAEPAQAGGEGGTVAWFRRRLPQGLAAAASVAVLGLAGYVAVGGGGGGDDSGGSTAEDAAVAGGQAEGDDTASGFGPSSDGARIAPQETQLLESPTSEPPNAAEEYATTGHVDQARLTAAVEDVVQGRAAPVPNEACGADLSAELGLPVVGSTLVGSGVLVVLEGAATYDGWLLYTCSSTSNETLEPQVEVPKGE